MKIKGISVLAATVIVAAAASYQSGLWSLSSLTGGPGVSQRTIAGTWVHIHTPPARTRPHIEEIRIDADGNYEIRAYDVNFRASMVDISACSPDAPDPRTCGGGLILSSGTVDVADGSLDFRSETDNRFRSREYGLQSEQWIESSPRQAALGPPSVLTLRLGDGPDDEVRRYYDVPDGFAADFRNLVALILKPMSDGACALDVATEAGVLDQWTDWVGDIGGVATAILHMPVRERAHWRDALRHSASMPASDHPTITAAGWQGLNDLYHTVDMVEYRIVPGSLRERMTAVRECR